MSEEMRGQSTAADTDGQHKDAYRDEKVPEGRIACILAESACGGMLRHDTLEVHYKSYVAVRDEYRKATTIAMTIWAILFLLQIGGLEKAEIMGVEPRGDVLKMVGLFAFCFSFMRAMGPWQKAGLYQVYFQELYLRGDGCPAIRQELVLRYPLAFDAMMFLREMVGMPEGWKRQPNVWRIRLIIGTGLVLLATLTIAVFWLLGAVVIDVVRNPGSVGLFWTWTFVISSGLCLLFGFTISSQRHRVLTYAIPVDSEIDKSPTLSPRAI